jgi:hypothetical protein
MALPPRVGLGRAAKVQSSGRVAKGGHAEAGADRARFVVEVDGRKIPFPATEGAALDVKPQ